jgi:single-strand DNA-binding protein
MYNKVILVGRLTRDIELKYLPSGSSVANFGLATSRNWKDQNTGEKKEETMFIDITVFGKGAEIANQYLRKGNRVLVEGRLSLDQWQDNEGNKRSKHKIIADNVQFMETKAESMASASSSSSSPSYDTQSNATQNNVVQNNTKQPSNQSQDIDIEDDDIPF